MAICNQCGKKPAVYEMGGHLLCVDCNLKIEQAAYYREAALAANLNFCLEHMETVMGLPGSLPRHEIPKPPVHIGDQTVNAINVSNSNVGVINTGNVERISVSLRNVRASGDLATADAIERLAKTVIADKSLGAEVKDEVLENLSYVTLQASTPQNVRQKSIGRHCIERLSQLLSTAANVATVWTAVQPVLAPLFTR